jgi:poly(A) polymerase
MKESTLKRFLRVENFGEHLELHRLDCLSSHGHLDHYELMKRKWGEMPPSELKPPPLITGSDLIAAGYQPGPAFSRILAAVEDEQLEGRIRTPEEAMALVRARFRVPEGNAVE